MVCPAPLLTVVTWGTVSPPGCLRVRPYHPCGPQDPPPSWDCPCPLFGGHGVSSALWCPAVDAVNITLTKEAEDMRDRSTWPGLLG